MKANKFLRLCVTACAVILFTSALHAIPFIESSGGLDDSDKIMRILYAVAALITLFLLNFYRKQRK